MDQCRALKRDGSRCPNRAKAGYGGFCGRHFPKDVSKLVTSESKSAKVQKYIAIASGIGSLIKIIWDAIEAAGSIGRMPPDVFQPYSHKIGTLHERAVLFASKAAQGDVPVKELQADAEMLDKYFDAWFSTLPINVQNSIFKYLDKEKIEDADKEELRRDLFNALLREIRVYNLRT